MIKDIQLVLAPSIANQEHLLIKEITEYLGIENHELTHYRIINKSIDLIANIYFDK